MHKPPVQHFITTSKDIGVTVVIRDIGDIYARMFTFLIYASENQVAGCTTFTEIENGTYRFGVDAKLRPSDDLQDLFERAIPTCSK